MKTKKGRHTELISLYIAKDTELSKKTKQIYEWQAKASNIRDKTTRKNVVDALEKIAHFLKTYYTKTPSKGLAVFSGNIREETGYQDIGL